MRHYQPVLHLGIACLEVSLLIVPQGRSPILAYQLSLGKHTLHVQVSDNKTPANTTDAAVDDMVRVVVTVP